MIGESERNREEQDQVNSDNNTIETMTIDEDQKITFQNYSASH